MLIVLFWARKTTVVVNVPPALNMPNYYAANQLYSEFVVIVSTVCIQRDALICRAWSLSLSLYGVKTVWHINYCPSETHSEICVILSETGDNGITIPPIISSLSLGTEVPGFPVWLFNCLLATGNNPCACFQYFFLSFSLRANVLESDCGKPSIRQINSKSVAWPFFFFLLFHPPTPRTSRRR